MEEDIVTEKVDEEELRNDDEEVPEMLVSVVDLEK